MTKRQNTPEDEVLLMALGEAQQDPATADHVAPLRQALAAVTPPTLPGPSDEFNRKLQQRLTQQAMKPAAAARASRFRVLGRYGAIAASLLIGIALGAWLADPASPPVGVSIAWGDVVRAMDRVQQFRITAFADEPASVSHQMYRVDLFYRQPDSWRAHGFDMVQFQNGGVSKLYSVEKRQFVDPASSRVRLIWPEFVQDVKTKPLLTAILERIFDGNPPAGEPVRSDQAAEGQGVEVFDYARDAKRVWARIWVLRESRLPIRIKVFQPGWNDMLLVEFDYSDPQPASFFDPDTFVRTLKEKHYTTTREIYDAGTEPVSGTRPRSAGQIYQVQGGYRVPQIQQVIAAQNGDLAIVTDQPENRTPSGHHPLGERFEPVRDNWGNEYIQITWQGNGQTKTWYFTPLHAFRHGQGPRTIELSYQLTGNDEKLVHKTEVLAQQKIDDITFTPAAQLPANWAELMSVDRKYSGLQGVLEHRGTLQEQLQAIQRWEAESPDSLGPVIWRIDLMRRHDREPAAYSLFEQKVKQRLLDDPSLLFNYRHAMALAQYMFDLADTGQLPELQRITRILEQAKSAALASQDRRAREDAQRTYEADYSLLREAMLIPRALSEFETMPRPAFVRVLTSKDGCVFYHLRLPPQPSWWKPDSWGGMEFRPMEFWSPLPDKANQPIHARYPDPTKSELQDVARIGTTGKLTITGTPQLLRDRQAGGKTIRRTWSISIDLPEPTIDNMQTWWLQNAPKESGWWAGPKSTAPGVEQWLNQAFNALKDERYDEAAELYRKVLDTPDEQWPDYYRDTANNGPLLLRTRQRATATLAAALARQSQIAEAQKLIQSLEQQLPPEPQLEQKADITARESVRMARLAIVRQFIAEHRLTDAQALMDTMARQRPDLMRVAPYHDYMVREDADRSGNQQWWFAGNHRDAWREYDTVLWDLIDAQPQAATQPPPATSPPTAASRNEARR